MTAGTIHVAGTSERFLPGETIFAQGARCSTVMYIARGRVRLCVASPGRKNAVMATLGAGTFFGEGALAGQRRRKATAVAVTATTIRVLKTAQLRRRLRDEVQFSDWFRLHLLTRNVGIEESLVGRLFNGSEKRLARTLMLLAHFDEHEAPRYELPMISRKLLAEASGTTRSKVDSLMNDFRKRGFLERGARGNSSVHVHRSMVNVLLQD